jgi:hypothetical protein
MWSIEAGQDAGPSGGAHSEGTGLARDLGWMFLEGALVRLSM